MLLASSGLLPRTSGTRAALWMGVLVALFADCPSTLLAEPSILITTKARMSSSKRPANGKSQGKSLRVGLETRARSTGDAYDCGAYSPNGKVTLSGGPATRVVLKGAVR